MRLNFIRPWQILILRIIVLLIIIGVSVRGTEAGEMKVNFNSWGPTTEGFRMSSSLEKETVESCEPIILNVIIKNVSTELLRLSESSIEKDYRIEVKDEQNRIASLTKYGEKLFESLSNNFRRIVREVKDQEEIGVMLRVNKIYDMTISGEYSIQVKRNVFKREGVGVVEVVSNVVNVRVIEGECQ